MEELAPYRVMARNIDPDTPNKIHDDDIARRLGFAGGLVPGVELFAYLTHPFVAAWGREWLDAGRLEVRFRRPVYEGEELVATADPGEGGYAVGLEGPDGEPRALGFGAPPAPEPAPDLTRFPVTPLPQTLRNPSPEDVRPGPLGGFPASIEAAANTAYLDAIGDPWPGYREGLVHPGLLLRLANALLMCNVELGPWIHTASDCRLLSAVTVPAQLEVRGVVTDEFERNGNSWVRYDVLVLAGQTPVMEVHHSAIYALNLPPAG